MFLALVAPLALGEPPTVVPAFETEPVRSEGDAADDIAVWINPADPSKSRILGTDKQRGIVVYDLSGRIVQEVVGGRENNVDVLTGFSLGGREVDLAVGSAREGNRVSIYEIDRASGEVRVAQAPPVVVEGGSVYGLCAMRSARSGRFYVFVTTTADEVQQWRLFERDGAIGAELVRRFGVGGHCEGMTTDPARNSLLVAEERVGIWRYEAEPAWLLHGKPAGHEEKSASESGPRWLIAQVGRDGLAPEVEGLAIYPTGATSGVLIASCQGKGWFAMFDREPPHRPLGTFRVGEGDGVDGVSGTDGVEAVGVSLGAAFPRGVFIAQDNENEGDDGPRQNFKVVAWERVADLLGR